MNKLDKYICKFIRRSNKTKKEIHFQSVYKSHVTKSSNLIVIYYEIIICNMKPLMLESSMTFISMEEL